MTASISLIDLFGIRHGQSLWQSHTPVTALAIIMNCRILSHLMSLSSVAYLCFFILLSNATSSLNEEQVTFISGGQVFTNPLLTLLNPGMSEVNFDQQGFSVLEVSHLFEYLNQQSRPLEFSNERDVLSYSLLLRFADSLKSQSLFEFVAHDFYHLLGTCLFNYIHKIPEIRLKSFAPILFRVYLNLSSNLGLEERVRMLSFLMNSVPPIAHSVTEFFSHFDFKVLQVIASEDLKMTEWTLEIEEQLHTSFLIGNYGSEEWHLKFVDGNPHFELARFLATKSTEIGPFDLAFLFSALERRHLLTLKEKETALRIANNYQLGDAIQLLKEINLQAPDQSLRWNDSSTSSFRSSRKRRRADIHIGEPQRKKRRMEETIRSLSSVQRFRLIPARNRNKTVDVQERNPRLLKHLQENLFQMENKAGKLEYPLTEGTKSKLINLPDLSWKAVKSFVEVSRAGLAKSNGPPLVKNYKLERMIPNKKGDRKNLMSQVAQMVCVAIRFKLDEAKLFLLLDWYKLQMEGVWEELLECGNEFAKEVDDVRKDFSRFKTQSNDIHLTPIGIVSESKVSRNGIQPAQEPACQSLDHEKPLNSQRSLLHSRNSYSTVKRFIISTAHQTKVVTVQEGNYPLLIHLQENLDSLNHQTGKLVFSDTKGTVRKDIKLPDLSWEAVKSYAEVSREGLGKGNDPPLTNKYQLARRVPTNEEEQTELMIQVAQMVCVAIRFKFDESKLFSLLDWYTARMEGVWGELLQSGNEFVKEVDEARIKMMHQSIENKESNDIVQVEDWNHLVLQSDVLFDPHEAYPLYSVEIADQVSFLQNDNYSHHPNKSEETLTLKNALGKPERNDLFNDFWELEFEGFDT